MFKNNYFRNFMKCLLEENRKIIIWGLGRWCTSFINNLYLGEFIDVIVDASEKEVNIDGNIIKTQLPSRDIFEKNKEAILVVGSPVFSHEILNEISQLSIKNDVVLMEKLVDNDYRTLCYYLEDFARINHLKKNECRQKIREVINKIINDNIFCFPKFSFQITTKCTLSCKDCRALIPYVKERWDVPLDELKEEMKVLFSNVDMIGSVEMIGGETLIYPNLAEAIEYASSFDSVSSIRITTNCTVIPNDEVLKSLSNRKVIVQLSDYGILSQMAKLVEVLERYNINFEIEKYELWEDCGPVQDNQFSEEQIKDYFRVCTWSNDHVKLCYIVSHGKIWSCPRSARIFELGYSVEEDAIDISSITEKDEIRSVLLEISNRDRAKACNFCNIGDKNREPVIPALQTDRDIFRSKYTIVERSEYNHLLKIKLDS